MTRRLDWADYRTTDYQIGGTFELPAGISFAAPDGTDDAKVADGFLDVTWSGTDVAVFDSDGSVRVVGAFRTGDLEGNFLEIRVEPQATARVEIRKWDGAEYLAQFEVAGADVEGAQLHPVDLAGDVAAAVANEHADAFFFHQPTLVSSSAARAAAADAWTTESGISRGLCT